MKSIIATLLFVLGLTSVFAQEKSMSGPIDEIEHMYLISSSEDKLVYQRSEGTYKKFKQFFKVVDLESGEITETVLEPIQEEKYYGSVFDQFVHDGYIYELVRFVKSSFTTSCKVGLVKRNIESFEQEGPIKWLGEFYIYNAMMSPGISLYQDEAGFYVVSNETNADDCFVSRFDFELNEEWKSDMGFLSEESVSLTSVTIDESNNMLMALSIKAEVKSSSWSFKTPVRSSGLMFLYVQNDGEVISVSPEFRESIYVKMYDFKYYPELNELVGVFSITKVIDQKKQETAGIGYAYMKWNLEGDLVVSNSKYLTYEDLASEEMENYYELSRLRRDVLEGDEGLPTINNYSSNNFQFMFKPDGGVIVAFKKFRATRGMNETPYREIDCSKLLFEIDTDGDLKWTHFFPYYMNAVNNFALLHYKDNKVYMYTKEFIKNFENNKFVLKTLGGSGAWDSVILAERVIDCETGEVESFGSVLDAPIENYMFKGGYNNYVSKVGDDLLFQYHYTRKNSKKYLRLTF